MKICIAISTIDKTAGGPSRSVPLLAKGLSECGIDVTLLTKETADMNLEILENSKVKIEIIPKKISDIEVIKFLKCQNFEIVHTQNLWDPFYHYIARFARKNKIPYIMTPRGTLEAWCLNQKKYKKKLALALYQRNDLNKASCVLATAEMEAESIRRIGVGSPIAVIPNGIDISEYHCRTIADQRNVKKQILFLSRIHKKKGIELLINAWAKLFHKYPDWNIIIAGNGEQEYISKLNQIILEVNLQNNIKIIDPVFGLAKIKLYKESALFVLPTYSENFGMVIAEAMSCGVPVITTTGTPWGILNDTKIGWCIEPSEENLTQTLSEAIELGLENLFELGQQASLFIKESYGYKEIAKKMRDVYEWVLGKSNKPDCILL